MKKFKALYFVNIKNLVPKKGSVIWATVLKEQRY